ncbi:uncharacterized protein TRAVEDRAFT_53454 [Trametes versicolor FP-101664 SS1]|uniref:uncharacterized protein n=1 Tax=Trametes versicolor (strain FP-101664) TaxID=717944 RepID=UPI000462395A|nr:uncharacterized protein TRAVEDRAFT_53454 [Trametes versicolor FP-101664 SS1]EIW53037.1 hypothetical protein TRAVEDRAFT_53454 [Trametes versicolor FP-101664 SS1]
MKATVNKLFYTAGGNRRRHVSEDKIAKAIVEDVINKIALPGKLRAAISQNNHSTTDRTNSSVEAALYPRVVLPQNNCPDWTHLRLFIEFKKGGIANDPFDDKSDHPETWAQSRQDVREQLLAYASNTFQYQHRTALYSLLINGDKFRGMYWDRAGLIVTNAINYLENPGSLLQFLWAFASLSDERQGLDPTATLLVEGSDEYELMDAWAVDNPALDMPFQELADVSEFPDSDTLPPPGAAGNTHQNTSQPSQPLFKYVRENLRKSLVKDWPRYRLLVGEDEHEFLVAYPAFEATSMFGRGTRGYIACDVKNNKFVWLKDSWRPFYEGVEQEGVYLETMASKLDIKLNLPTVVAHGDVLQQTTYIAGYTTDGRTRSVSPPAESASDESTRGKKRPREEVEAEPESVRESRLLIHYRLAVEEVCMKMGDFTNGKQLVKLVSDCIITHRDAYEHFGILHRDVSTGNMLVLPRIRKCKSGKTRVFWEGFLTDWELAKHISKDTALQPAEPPEPTGTWQFMSVEHVRHPERPVGVADDLESFFHVLLYHSLRCLRHTLDGLVQSFVSDYFDTVWYGDDPSGKQMCSNAKVLAATQGIIPGETTYYLKFLNDRGVSQHPLNNLFRTWLELYIARYHILKKQDNDLRFGLNPVRGTSPAQRSVDVSASKVPDDESRNIVEAESKHLQELYADDSDFQDSSDEDSSDEDSDSEDEAHVVLRKKRAAQLETHSKTIRIFRRYLRKFPWPTTDVVGDQLVATCNPTKQIAALKPARTSNAACGETPTPSKRARIDHSADVASGSRPTSAAPPHAARPSNTAKSRGRRFTQQRLTRARR